MNRSHNKKRNIGIIYDQIINFTCLNILEENNNVAEQSLNIVKKYFKENTQLYKEYKLFKALATTSNISDQLASNIIKEARNACNNMFNDKALEKEKSLLIKDLNYSFGKGKIFEQKISNYRIYATIQTLLNEWRKNSNNFDLVTEYEIKLHENLTKKEVIVENKQIQSVDPLTYNLMREMFSKKYDSLLDNNQKNILSLFISDKDSELSDVLSETKTSCLSEINHYFKQCNNNILLEKKNIVLNRINSLKYEDVSKNNIEKFLTIIKLKNEILGDK
jgi:hypothetical protein